MTLDRPAPQPGWYPNQHGQMQWWDGHQWGVVQPQVVMRSAKESGIAYLLLILLGGFAAHRFYLRRTGSAIVFLIMWWVGWLTTVLIVGWFLVFGGVVWWIIDLFLIPGMVREENARPPR